MLNGGTDTGNIRLTSGGKERWCSLENEEKGFDAENFYDEGVVDAEGQVEDVVEKPQDDSKGKADETLVDGALKATEEDSKEESTEAESTIKQLLNKDGSDTVQEETGKPVPLPTYLRDKRHWKDRTQAAEAKVKELEEQITRPDGEKSEKDNLSDIPDDEYLDKSQVQKILKAQEDNILKKVKSDLETSQRAAQIKVLADKSVASEVEFKKEHADYDTITKSANQLKLLTDDDRREIFSSNRPAQKYYELAKEKLEIIRTALGGEVPKESQTKEKTAESKDLPEDQTDNDIFDDVFGKEEQPEE